MQVQKLEFVNIRMNTRKGQKKSLVQEAIGLSSKQKDRENEIMERGMKIISERSPGVLL